ncbi:universal stress protein [uncultured Jatrophihabitans sp.]|uniref:universal stress protein n=1 Tax=uncultured Jatrophihabitans sp. TaxID=1610747 RepID=UPI0035CB96FF
MTSAQKQPVILACYDGSEGSRAALAAAAGMLAPSRAVVLTVWETVELRLTRLAAFGNIPIAGSTADADEQEQAAAQQAAEEGAARAVERGFEAEARIAQATESVWRTVVEVADEIDADLILVGSRGRGTFGGAVLGSTSHGVLQHARRPVLVSPESERH